MLVSEIADYFLPDTMFITYYANGHFQVFRGTSELIAYLGNEEVESLGAENVNGEGYIVVNI